MSVAPQDGHESGDNDTGGPGFWAHPLDSPVINRVAEIVGVAHLPVLRLPFAGEIQIEGLDDDGFRIETGKGDDADPDADTKALT